jgi:predicted permease
MRQALRTVFKSPGFSAIAIATLAVGIGLNVALFGIFNALLFRPLPVRDPGGLLAISSASTKPDGPRGHLTYPDFEDLRGRRDVLADAFAFTQVPVGLSAAGRSVRARGQIVTTNMFDVLGTDVAVGRPFAAADDTERVVVIAYDTWQRIFGADEGIIGRPVNLNGHPFTVIGVSRRGFPGPDRFEPADLWIPLGAHETVLPGERDLLSRGNWWLTVVGRLAPGVSLRQARAVLDGVARGIAASVPDSHDGFFVRVTRYHGTSDDTRGQVAPVAAMVMGVTLCVLLIACANVAGLLLSRTASRQREIGIRIAIGATRGALTRQFLAESLVLAAAAGVAGLIIAMWGTEAIVRFAAIPAAVEATPDWRVVLFTVSASLLAGLAFGLAPALRASALPLLPALRSEPGADSRPRSSRLQRGLVIGQLAMSLVMLSSAGILLRGLEAAWHADVGFQYEKRIAISTDLRLQNYDAPRTAAFLDRAVASIRALPGVDHATYAHLVPFGGRVFVYGLSFPEQSPDPDARPDRVSVNQVGPDFFTTMGISIVRGRGFIATDFEQGRPLVAIVSETMANRYWKEGDAIGRRFSIDGPKGPFRTVIGVARDVQIDEFTERPWPAAWVPYKSEPGELVILAASARPPGQVVREVEAALRGIDAGLPLYSARPVRDYIAERLDGERALSKLLTICGALALTLAGLGLYGVTAYGVTRRTREIGVRMALGADRGAVLDLFVREALRLSTRGVIWGFLPAIAATYALSGLFVGVFPVDLLSLGAATVLLVAVTLLAAYVPARRATQVDPLIALRTE